LASVVSEVVDELNLTAISEAYSQTTRGTVPYHPRMLVKVLVQAYAVEVPSSRQIAWELDEDVAFRCWRRTSGCGYAAGSRKAERNARR
jgi:transposase